MITAPFSHRRLRTWESTVGLGALLVSSLSGRDDPPNADIVLQGKRYAALSLQLPGNSGISPGREPDFATVGAASVDGAAPQNAFARLLGEGPHLVDATSRAADENDPEYSKGRPL
jgi:hypothetical protein